MFHRVKSFAEVYGKKAKSLTIRVIQVAVDPMFNWQTHISLVFTHSLGKLWGAEVVFKALAGKAGVYHFLESARFKRGAINATIITTYFRNIHFEDR